MRIAVRRRKGWLGLWTDVRYSAPYFPRSTGRVYFTAEFGMCDPSRVPGTPWIDRVAS